MRAVFLFSVCALCVVGLPLACGGTAEDPEVGDKIIVVDSRNDEIVTVSDLYSYSGPHGTGTRTTHMAKGDPADDVHIVPHGMKSFYLGQCKSWTISFMYEGKEIEMDSGWDENMSKQSAACFDSDFGGLFAVDYDVSVEGELLPGVGIPRMVVGGAGHIEGGEYDWITFYDATATGGMIERDALGNPISPVLPDGTMVTAVFLYDVVTFELTGGDCPKADLTGDCFVDFNDFAIMANQWLTDEPGEPHIPDDMVHIPGETFEMGDHFNEGNPDERPVHTVTVDSFYMGRFEITNGQYCDYLNSALGQGLLAVTDGVVYMAGSGTSYPYCDTHIAVPESQIDYSGGVFSAGVFSVREKAGRNMSEDPMVVVSWYGAAAYCNWRSAEEGYEQLYDPHNPDWTCDLSKKGYRLATEAEWEYAARGGLFGKRFPSGDTISHSQANYDSYWEGGHPYFPGDVSPTEGYHPDWNDAIYPYTSPVGSFETNGYGLHDMAGNVWEWCNDWYDSNYYDQSPTDNPTGPPGGVYRVVHGGGWYGHGGCRVAQRAHDQPDRCFNFYGFRIVLKSD